MLGSYGNIETAKGCGNGAGGLVTFILTRIACIFLKAGTDRTQTENVFEINNYRNRRPSVAKAAGIVKIRCAAECFPKARCAGEKHISPFPFNVLHDIVNILRFGEHERFIFIYCMAERNVVKTCFGAAAVFQCFCYNGKQASRAGSAVYCQRICKSGVVMQLAVAGI